MHLPIYNVQLINRCIDIVPSCPTQLHEGSSEVEVQQWLAYLHSTYPNPTHQLFTGATVMFRDSVQRNSWRNEPLCANLHSGAIFSEWLHMRVQPGNIRLGLFMSPEFSWVGNQTPDHQYPQHVWVAGIRKVPGQPKGRELIVWDNDWQRKREKLEENNKVVRINTALLGGQRALYLYLISPTQGKMSIKKVWIAGNGVHNSCLSESIAWLEGILQTGGLDGDLASLGFHYLPK